MSQFKQLPSPYSKYEVSESGSILRAIKTKSIVNVEKGTNSYRIYADNANGLRISLPKEKLKEIATEVMLSKLKEPEELTKKSKAEDVSEKELQDLTQKPKEEKKLLVKKKVESSKKEPKKLEKKTPKSKKEKQNLPREASIIYKVCKFIHEGKTKEQILKSGISQRQYTHCNYHYQKTYKLLFQK